MNRTTTVVVALIVAAGLTTMAYAVPAQQAFACHVGCGVPYPIPVPVPVFGGFFVHKTIIQTINQTNNCHTSEAASSQPRPLSTASALKNTTSNSEDQSDKVMQPQPQTQNDNKVVCLNTAANTASGFGGGLGFR
jgi:hypothetical protein